MPREREEGACFKTSIGGQALIEGLMMIGPKKRALAVRKPSGEIALEYLPLAKQWSIENWPIVRGSVKLIRQMVLGMKAMFRSIDLSEIAEDDEVTEGETVLQAETGAKGDKTEPVILVEKKGLDGFFERNPNALIAFTTVIALAISIFLFTLLPNAITDLLRRLLGLPQELPFAGQMILHLVEGLVRVLIFISYLAIMRRNEEMIRVWKYHGAEHKTIACYEAGEPLEVENVKKYSRFHPRCGTSFLFLVMMVSILVFSITGWHSPLVNLGIRLLLLPVVAGLSYELIRWTGKTENAISRIIRKPGLALQKLTTSEPDEKIIEVAIKAMEAVIPEDASDNW